MIENAPQECGALNMNTSPHIKALLLILVFFANQLPAWAADWDLKDLNGKHHKLSELKGKWVLVNFWAPWCPPCLEEMPELVALHKQHQNLQVIGVAIMYRKKRNVLDTVHQQSLPYPITLGSEDTAAAFGGIDALPVSFLYSPTGELAIHQEGPITQQDVEQIMTKAGK